MTDQKKELDDISSKNAFDILNRSDPRTFNPGPKPFTYKGPEMPRINRPPKKRKDYNVFKRIKRKP